MLHCQSNSDCPFQAVITIQNGVQFKHLCQVHAQAEVLDLILNSSQLTLRTWSNYPLPPVVEIFDRKEQVL